MLKKTVEHMKDIAEDMVEDTAKAVDSVVGQSKQLGRSLIVASE